MLNAFCRVAPSVRFRLRAILLAGVFFLASRFISRTSLAAQARRFFPFLISISLVRLTLLARSSLKGKPCCRIPMRWQVCSEGAGGVDMGRGALPGRASVGGHVQIKPQVRCRPLARYCRHGQRSARQLCGVKRTPRFSAAAAANDP